MAFGEHLADDEGARVRKTGRSINEMDGLVGDA
jgi:hypothetical protein